MKKCVTYQAKSRLPLGAMVLFLFPALVATGQQRPLLRDYGIRIGVIPTGANNSITDVAGVRVGQITLIKGDSIRTGVTAILPHGGNLF